MLPLETNVSCRFRLSLLGLRRPLRPLETDLSPCFRFSLPGPRRRPLRHLETNLSSRFPVAGIAGGRCLLSCHFGLEI